MLDYYFVIGCTDVNRENGVAVNIAIKPFFKSGYKNATQIKNEVTRIKKNIDELSEGDKFVEDFNLAGISGVTNENIDLVNQEIKYSL